MASSPKMTFDDFRKVLAQRLGIPIERLTPKASLLDDLGIDSIRMVEILLEFERMGVKVPLEKAWEIQTVEDSYNFYQKYA